MSRAQLFVRTDRPGGVGFHDYSHSRPIRSRDWTIREIVGNIAADAVRITVGLMLVGSGSAYIADPEFERIESQ